MPVILKKTPPTIKQTDKLVRLRSSRSSASDGKPLARNSPSVALSRILKTATREDDQGRCGFDCLETAARVIEIQFPEMPIAKDMRRLVNEIGRFRDC
jgi:hypothetical protein